MLQIGQKRGKKSLWKRIPFNIRLYIIAIAGITFLIFLFVFSCAGGADQATKEIETKTQETSALFYIEWADGETEDAYIFLTETSPKNVQEMSLVTRTTLRVQSITIYFGKDPPVDLSVQINVPIMNTGGMGESVTEILAYTFTLNAEQGLEQTFEFEGLVAPTLTGQNIEITFSEEIVLECITAEAKRGAI